jgi:hypothetical protein
MSMKRLINILLLSCQKATALIEKEQYFGLSLLEKLKLRAHLTICDYCTQYKLQSKFIHDCLGNHEHEHGQSQNQSLKDKIINEIEKL